MSEVGATVGGKYRIVRRLGAGASATTFEAETLEGGSRVAIKIMELRGLRDWKLFELFERETAVLSRLRHRSLPRMLDSFRSKDGEPPCFYIVESLAPGQSLAERVAAGFSPSETEVRAIARQVLEVLAYLHGILPPIVHRDVKPANLVRDDAGAVVLVDFGSVQDVVRDSLAAGTTVAGTFGYMAPEQIRGVAVPASDLYSLGATLVFLLARRSPAELPHRRNVLDLRAVEASPPMRRWLARLVATAVEDRFPSARAALAAMPGGEATLPLAPILAVAASLVVAAGGTAMVAWGMHGSPSDAETPAGPEHPGPDAAPLGPLGPAPPNPEARDPRDPVAWWRWSRSCGASADLADFASRGHAGHPIGEIDCNRSQAISFQRGHYEVADAPDLHFVNALTIAARVRPTRVTGLGTIVNKWYAPDSYMLLVQDGHYRFSLATPGGAWGVMHNVETEARAGTWATLVGTFDGHAMKLFRDGALVAQAAVQGPLQDSSRPIEIGSHPDWNQYAGLIADVRLYAATLTDAQIRDLTIEMDPSAASPR